MVEDILLEDRQDVPCPSLPRPESLARAANPCCERLRLEDPWDLEFEITADHIPSEFLHADIRVQSWRHVIFTDDQQLEFLARSKSQYVDATFKLSNTLTLQSADDGQCPCEKGRQGKTSAASGRVDVQTTARTLSNY